MTILHAGWACILCAFYAASALGWGLQLLRVFPAGDDRSAPSQTAFAAALGMGILGTLWSALSIVPGGLQVWTALPLLLLPLPFSWARLVAVVSRLDLRAWLPDDRGLRVLALTLLTMLVLAVPMMWSTFTVDAIAFYFAQTKLMAYVHGFTPLPGYENFSLIPLPAELSGSVLMLLGGDMAARMTNLIELWIGAGLIVSLAATCGLGRTGRWLALLLFLSSSSVNLLIAGGKTDLYSAMLGLATLYAFVALPKIDKRSAALMGLLTGFAVTAKLSFLPVLAPMLIGLLAWRILREERGAPALRRFLISGIVTGALMTVSIALFMLRNAIFYHEPFAPIYFFDKGRNIGITDQAWYSPAATRWILLTYPLVWTLGQYPMQLGDLSPLVWAALPAAYFARRASFNWRNNISLVLAVAGLAGVVAWAIAYPAAIAPRYIFPALFAFIPLAACGLARLWHAFDTDPRKQKLFAALLTLYAAVQILNGLPAMRDGLYVLLNKPPHGYAAQIDQGLRAGESRLGASDRLLLIGWERATLQDRTLSCLVSQDEVGIKDIVAGKTPSTTYWGDFYRAGARIVLVNRMGRKDFVSLADPAHPPSWLHVDSEPVNDLYTIYTLTPGPDAPPPEKKCAQDMHGVWRTVGNQ